MKSYSKRDSFTTPTSQEGNQLYSVFVFQKKKATVCSMVSQVLVTNFSIKAEQGWTLTDTPVEFMLYLWQRSSLMSVRCNIAA